MYHLRIVLLHKTGKLCNFLHSDHCVKSVRIWSYSGPHFPAFGLNTERYSVSLRIQFECGKKLTRITPNTDTLYAVAIISNIWSSADGLRKNFFFNFYIKRLYSRNTTDFTHYLRYISEMKNFFIFFFTL